MSDWGRVALFYDYEKNTRYDGMRNVRGLISKAYKYPGVVGMILHAYYGIQYFLERFDNSRFHFDGEDWADEMGLYAELNTAFDVYFDFGKIDHGYDSVKRVLEKRISDALTETNKGENTDETDDEEVESLLFNCEGMYGWLYFKFTGSIETGYALKYGYYYGSREYEYEVADLKRAIEIETKYNPEFAKTLEDETIQEAIAFIEENAELMSEEEFWNIEELGAAWVKEQRSKKGCS